MERISAGNDLLETAPCGVLRFADDGRVLQVNRTLLEMLGYAREEVEGLHVERLLTVGTGIFYQTHWFPLLRLHGRAEEVFLMLRAKSGEEVGTLVNAVRREEGGVADSYVCILMRVRERQKYEEELLRARRTADEARAAAEARGRELEQVNEQLEAQAIEMELQQQQLQEQTLELEATSTELRRLNLALTERTEEAERMRAEADEANRAKSSFLAVMSHELRTPLNAIQGYLEILDLGIHGPLTDAQRDTVGRIGRNQRHLLRLINEVLNLARIEAGHVEYAVGDLPADDLVRGVIPMIETQMDRRQISFSVEIEPGLVLRVDRDKTEQILLNLLGNAAKFTPPGGRVRLRAEPAPEPPGAVLVKVMDTGIGIPASKLDSVFEPFVQVDTTNTRETEGTGLGLAISRDLARGMGGDLFAESSEGEGSTFTLVVPGAGAAG